MMILKQIIFTELPYVERSHSLSDVSVHNNRLEREVTEKND